MPDDLSSGRLDDAFRAGRATRARGVKRDDNPHPLPSAETNTPWNAWRAGWAAEHVERRRPEATNPQTGV